MALTARGGADSERELIEPGMYAAVCYAVVDCGTKASQYSIKEKHQVYISWEIPSLRIQFEKDGQAKNLPRSISEWYTLSLFGDARLAQILQGWRGRLFTDVERESFDLKTILGKSCYLVIEHREKANGKIADTAKTAMPYRAMPDPKNPKAPLGFLTPLVPENDLRWWSFEECARGEPVVFPDWMSERMQAMLKEANEYRDLSAESITGPPERKDADLDTPFGEGEDDVPF